MRKWRALYLLIEAAKMNNVKPFAYLKATLEAIAAGHLASKTDELLPWAFTPPSNWFPGASDAPLIKDQLDRKTGGTKGRISDP